MRRAFLTVFAAVAVSVGGTFLAGVTAGKDTCPSMCFAGQVGFEEDFALARDRAVSLKQLIPGTRDYYYYHCLHYQNLGKPAEVDRMLKLWIARHNRTGRVREIENRRALLKYDRDHAGTLAYLRKTLSLRFNHQRELLDSKPQLPTSFPGNLISRETLTRRAFARHKQTLGGFENSALDWLITQQLSGDRRRHLLRRLTRPDYANLPKLVVDDLKHKYSRGFGSLPVHKRLLLPQLDECLRLKPDLLNKTNFVNTYLAKLRPGADVDWKHDAAERERYLGRLWSFVSKLNQSHVSLRANVLYHRLVHDRARGIHDKGRFMEYIRIPRSVGYVNSKYLQLRQHRGHHAKLNADYRRRTFLPPIRRDEPLVRDYLAHFFLTEDSAKPYEAYIDDAWLKHVLAEAKIVNGLGDMEKWYSHLPPAKYQALKERVDIDFAHTNKKVFGPDEPVGLDLHVKNVKKLIVKVFEINAMNYYREKSREVNTDVNLDGLVANEEKVHAYGDVALRRVKRRFEFPSLRKRGVYVVEFIGNGKSSRALIRKGKLRYLVRTGAAGHVFTILDEANRKLSAATLWLAGKEYKPDKDGTIAVPFTAKPGRQAVILKMGNFATLAHFDHESENYKFSAGIYVDRESLLKRRTASVIVRTALYVNRTPVTLSILEDVALTIASVDGEGVVTTRKVNDFKLFEDRESTCEFKVPENVRRIDFTLSAKVMNLSRNKKENLSARNTFSLNGIDDHDKVEDLHLRHVGGKYFLDVLGKTGEQRKDRPVRLTFKHRDFKDAVHAALQTDEKGTIALGELAGIEWVRARGAEGTDHKWFMPRDLHSTAEAVHGNEGDVLFVPYMGKAKQATPAEFSLLETRGGTFVRDRMQAVSVRDGFLVLAGLTRGDYDLLIKSSGTRVKVRVTNGVRRPGNGYVSGENRQLEVKNARPLQIAGVGADANNVRIRLKNATKFARVHVAATRYMPEYSIAAELGKIRFPGLSFATLAKTESLYVAGRNIGDEYRYILERKYAKKYPGNLLTRPGLLLNPWAIRKTETTRQDIGGEEEWLSSGGYRTKMGDGGGGGGYLASRGKTGLTANLDFLAEQAVVMVNLRADAAGVVTIPRKKLGAHQQLHVIAVDPQNTVYRELSLADVPAKFLDLRLAKGLDPAGHFTEQKQISVVNAKQKFVLEDAATAQMELYDSLGKAYVLYVTLSNDATLKEFAFILDWPKMKEEEKREKYSKYACHELNFFLYRKDPAFFEKVVQPYLRNKKDKTFLDEFLIGADLSRYMKPWNHARLNVVERILLSQRIRGERPQTSRHVGDLFDLLPPDVERRNHLFRTALKGRALDVGVMVTAPKPMPIELPSRADTKAREPSGARDKTRKEVMDQLEEKEKGSKVLYFDDKSAAGRRRAVRRFYRKLDKTQEWVENNYYHLPIESQNADLVTVNAFWRDYARHDARRPFFSTNLAEVSRNFPEMMFALSVLDLPFEPKKHGTDLKENTFTLTPGTAAVIFHKEIKEAKAAEKTPILVSQNFFRHNDRYRHEHGERQDKFVTDEFLVHVVYGCQVVITNPTSSRQKLDVLLQIPRGALPVRKGFYTRGLHVDLEPYRTRTVEYYFYFPLAGKYAHYPVHVAKNERLIGFAQPATLNVVVRPSKIDRTSWNYISQHGTPGQVTDFLKQQNVNRIELGRIAWRMKDAAYFRSVTRLLEARHVYNHTLWSYGVRHDDARAIREYLQHCDSFVNRCGKYIDTTLLTIDPVVRRSYQFMEYSPLVNARAHRLGKRRKIVNDRFFAQYQRLMEVLRYRPALDDAELMTVTYYLILQDRVGEAIEFFSRVNPRKLRTAVQYDYAKAYLDFYSDDHKLARGIATRYREYPVDRWRKAFANLLAQLDEIDGKAAKVVNDKDRMQLQTRLAATEPGLDFKVEEKKVTVSYQNVKRCRVNYYMMDIELLFSRNPFVQEYSGQFAYIRPNHTAVVALPPGLTKHTFALPAQFHSSNVMVEIEAEGIKKSRAYFSHSLAVQVIENYGQIKVTHEMTGKPLSRVYVKVYARMNGGRVQFYKDGYTDLRGRFDYTSLNTNELDNVEKFSLLVLSETDGAVVREAAPPKR